MYRAATGNKKYAYRTEDLTWSGIGNNEGNASNERSSDSIFVSVCFNGVLYLQVGKGTASVRQRPSLFLTDLP